MPGSVDIVDRAKPAELVAEPDHARRLVEGQAHGPQRLEAVIGHGRVSAPILDPAPTMMLRAWDGGRATA
jgi:hypothetical protein